MKDSVDALLRLGHMVYSVDDGIDAIIERIKRVRPDLLFTLNNLGLEEGVLDAMDRPIISWITTEPQVLKQPKRAKHLIIFVVEKGYISQIDEGLYGGVFILPLAANPDVFKRLSLSREDIERYGCDVSFAGGCNYDIWYKRHRDGIDRFFSKDVVERLIERHSKDTSSPILDHLLEVMEEIGQIKRPIQPEIKEKLGIQLREELIVLHWAAMSKFRKDMIKGISDLGIRLYGDDGWEEIIGLSGITFHRFIDRDELVKLYNASKINLNLPTSSYLSTTTFNIPSTGSFMLSYYKEGLEGCFDIR